MKRFILLALCLTTTLATAQRLTLEQCIRYAQTNSPDVQGRTLQTRRDEAQLIQLRQSQWPSANGSYSQGLNLGRNIDPFTNVYVQQTIHSSSLGATLNWNVFNGFRTVNQIRQTEKTIQADVQDVAANRFDLGIQVTLAYMQLLQQQAVITIAENALSLIEKQRQRAEVLIREGQLALATLLDLDAQLATAKLDLSTARNAHQLARLNLESLLNWRSSEPLTIEPISTPELTAKPPPLTNLMLADRIVQRQPSLQAARFRLESADAGLALAKAGAYPTVSVGAGFGTAYSSVAARDEFRFLNQLWYNLGQYVRATVSFPIFDAGQLRFQLTQARLNRQSAIIQVERDHQRVVQAIRQAEAACQISLEALTNTRIVTESRRLAYEGAVVRFEEGLLHTVELETYRNSWLKAQTDLAKANYEVFFRKRVLGFYQ
ncbi:MAG: TolC family protein [Cytophagales bacterium]|nr:MAG: TolC family protein [Cytophagales bacterium]